MTIEEFAKAILKGSREGVFRDVDISLENPLIKRKWASRFRLTFPDGRTFSVMVSEQVDWPSEETSAGPGGKP